MLLIAVVVAVAGAIIAIYLSRPPRPPSDSNTLCSLDGPSAVLVVMLDRSDPFTVPQREGLRNRLTNFRDTLRVNERIDVYAVGDTEAALREPILSLCNPGTGAGLDHLTANPELIRKRWETEFATQIDAALADVLTSPLSEKDSPVMESLQSVAITALGRLPRDTPRRLVIASDMIQNTHEYSQYRRVEGFESFRGSAYFRRLTCDLGGADVTILYLNRASAPSVQGKDHVSFWREYISAMNGQLVSVVRIEG
jgi:hypothetical protein